MGGEEFLMVLEQAGTAAAWVAERLCAGWRLREPVTSFRAGVCVHSADRTPKRTLERSDAALYEAKTAGRDRVCGRAAPPAGRPAWAAAASGR